MKVGDLVRVQLGSMLKYGVVVQESKKVLLAGEVLKVLVEGEIKTVIKDRVVPIKIKREKTEA